VIDFREDVVFLRTQAYGSIILTENSMKVFLSHASEDKTLVEQVHLRICSRFPSISSWLDKYEILAGDDLIEVIHKGICDADKFLIFLSPNSIEKPWVRAELRKALSDEINGIKPEFIVPIKVGSIPSFPPFLESKFYIDIENKTEEEWLQDIYAAISRQKKPLGSQTKNLQVSAHIASDNPKAAMLVFEAMYWAEPISFLVKTSVPVKSTIWQVPGLRGMHQVSITELKGTNQYGLAMQNQSIKPRYPFIIGIEFDAPEDPRSLIVEVDKWDGVGGESSLRFISFN
jgi:hypothetical protein